MSEYADEEPISEEEEAYGRAYWETLSQGEPEPSSAGLDPRRVEAIREALEREWRGRVRRITRQRRRA